MQIDTFVLGDFQTNCYVVRTDESQKDCILIDPGLHPYPLVQFLQQQNLNPEAILITHGHIDHIGGVEIIRESWPKTKVYIHKDDAEMLTDPNENLSMLAGTVFQARPAEVVINGQTEIRAAGLRFEILHTPGHTPGGICLHCPSDGIAFVGDTLFAGSVGRSDFPGGSHEQLIQSIQTRLLVLPETTRIYPGHGPDTTLRNEKKHNPYL
ncbi:MAG: MBL fold metallo-hydrolase [Sedimentisphaerales bacterium]|nr:MBL fold metallo-hydrolase [Sedimentisphaerales bacterium]